MDLVDQCRSVRASRQRRRRVSKDCATRDRSHDCSTGLKIMGTLLNPFNLQRVLPVWLFRATCCTTPSDTRPARHTHTPLSSSEHSPCSHHIQRQPLRIAILATLAILTKQNPPGAGLPGSRVTPSPELLVLQPPTLANTLVRG